MTATLNIIYYKFAKGLYADIGKINKSHITFSSMHENWYQQKKMNPQYMHLAMDKHHDSCWYFTLDITDKFNFITMCILNNVAF